MCGLQIFSPTLWVVSLVCWLVFFCCLEAFNLIYSHLSIFAFLAWASWVKSKVSFPRPILWSFLHLFYSGNFIISWLIFVFNWFWVYFLDMIWDKDSINSPTCVYIVSKHHFLCLSFLHWIFLALLLKISMIISIDAEKSIDKSQYLFTIKTLNRLCIQWMYESTIKSIYEKPRVNIIFKCEKLKEFSLRSGIKHGCPFSLLVFNIVLKVLEQLSKRKNERHPKRKRENWVFSFCFFFFDNLA